MACSCKVGCCTALKVFALVSFNLNLKQSLFVRGEVDVTVVPRDFTKALLDKYGSGGQLTRAQFQHLSTSLGVDPAYNVEPNENTCIPTVENNCTRKCLGYDAIFTVYSNGDHLNVSSLLHTLPALVFSAQDDHCHDNGITHHRSTLTSGEGAADDTYKIQVNDTGPLGLVLPDKHYFWYRTGEALESAIAWGYSLGFGSLVVLISNIGIVLGPCMKTRIFQIILMFCVALAVGTLAGAGIMVLIPEALGLADDEHLIPDYHLKMTTTVAGIYLFFVVERLIKLKSDLSQNKKELELTVEEGLVMQNKNSSNHTHTHSHSHDSGEVATVAWTLLLGDALHNFSDGLAIGAGFTQSMLTGISVSLAVLSEELPHELGDIAILLHAGFSIKRALFCNFLAAVMIYLGVIIGVVVGENTAANTYIFALAAGLFIYIGLADMIPEMNSQAQKSAVGHGYGHVFVFIIQNIGLLCGFAIIITLVNFGSGIEVS